MFVPITDDNSNPCTTSTGCGISAVDFDKGLLAKPGGQFGTAAKRNYVVYPIIGAPAYPSGARRVGTNAVNKGPEYIALAKLDQGQVVPDLSQGLRARVRGDRQDAGHARRL